MAPGSGRYSPSPQRSIRRSYPTVPESFMDTPVINGTAYPYLVVDPKAYRFRILNAANDRFWNLSLYLADPAISVPIAGRTEVMMVPFNSSQNLITPFPEWLVQRG